MTGLLQNPDSGGNPHGFDALAGADHRLGYPWVCCDRGRSTSRRSRQRNDCTVRALAIACSLSYDDAYDLLKAAGRLSSRRFQIAPWLDRQEWATRIRFPAVKGQQRMNPALFVRQFPQGRFICKAAKHVLVVIDGAVFDATENRPDRCIYTAWEIRGFAQ